MTIETRRFTFLPWSTPFNTRPAKIGETLRTTKSVGDDLYIWELTPIGGDEANASHTLPINPRTLSREPVVTPFIIQGSTINSFGPPQRRPWRWRP